jgi:hypothetical protein
MRCSSVIQFLRTRSPLVALLGTAPLVVVILGLAACVKHPVGDPEKSKVDPKLAGAWLFKDENGNTLMILRPYDARTYFVQCLTYAEKNGAVEANEQMSFKAWLTDIRGAAFLCMEPLTPHHFLGLESEKPPYWVFKTELTGGGLSLRMLDDRGPVKAAKDSRELEAVIAKDVNADSLYDDAPIILKKTDDGKLIESVLTAFHFES